MSSGSPSSASNDSLLEAPRLPRRPRRLTFDTGGQVGTQAGHGARARPVAQRDPPMPAFAHRIEHRFEPRRPAGPLALAAAALVLAVIALLAFKQWFVLPEPVRSEQVRPGPQRPEQEPPTQASSRPSAPAPAPATAQAIEAGAGQGARMPPVTVQAAGARPAPPLPAAAPSAASDGLASFGMPHDGSGSSLSDNASSAARVGSLGPAAASGAAELPESKAPTSPALPPPAASEPQTAASTARSRRLADKPSSSELVQARSPRPAPAACRGTSGLVLAQCRACARLDVLQRAFCNERTRLAYCTGRYGRSADCPAPAVTTPN